MGAFYSVFNEAGNIIDVKYKGMEKKGDNQVAYHDFAEKYLEFYKKHGYIKIQLDSKKWKDYIESNVEIVETFNNINVNNRLIESFYDKKYKHRIDKEFHGIMMIGSLSGLYTIHSKKDFEGEHKGEIPIVDDFEIIFSKMFLMKDQYENIINAIFSYFFKQDLKKSEREMQKLKSVKTVVLELFKEINNKKYPEILFSNIIGILIKISILLVMEDLSKGDDKMEILIKTLIKDIISILPDDKCYLKDPDMNFVILDPDFCTYSLKSIPQQNADKCNSLLIKIKKDFELESAYNKNLEADLKNTKGSRDLWKYIAIGGILLFIIFLILYIMKSCPEIEETELE